MLDDRCVRYLLPQATQVAKISTIIPHIMPTMSSDSFWKKWTETARNTLGTTLEKVIRTASNAINPPKTSPKAAQNPGVARDHATRASTDKSAKEGTTHTACDIEMHEKRYKEFRKRREQRQKELGIKVPEYPEKKPIPKDADDSEQSLKKPHGFLYAGLTLYQYTGKDPIVQIPEGTKSIAEHAFANNKSLEEVIIPNTVTEIKAFAFANCISLKRVTLPNHRLFILLDHGTFKGCVSLTTINWSRSLKYVREDSIEQCPLSQDTRAFLQNQLAYIPDKHTYVLKSIARSYRYNNKLLKFFTNSVDQHAQNAPEHANKNGAKKSKVNPEFARKFIYAKPKNQPYPYLYIRGDVLIGIFDNVPIPKHIIIPPFIHRIGECAFNLAQNVQSITFEGELEEIAANAGTALSKLETLFFHAPVRRMGRRAFAKCTALRKVYFLDDVGDIEDEAFLDCSSLEQVLFDRKLNCLWHRCFCHCMSLYTIKLPDSCTIIGQECFAGCTALRRIDLPARLRLIQRGALAGCRSLQAFVWPEPFMDDKHIYPKVEPKIFHNILNGTYWEVFEKESGVYKRKTVLAKIEDPKDLFGMMLPGPYEHWQCIPQFMMNRFLNGLWESSLLNRQEYECQLEMLRACLTMVRILCADSNDDRAERLFVLGRIVGILKDSKKSTYKGVCEVLPSLLYETLFACCGLGNLRKQFDEELSNNVVYYALKHGFARTSAKAKALLFKELQIGFMQKDRYNPWKTQYTFVIDLDDVDYDMFSRGVHMLIESIFGETIAIPDDPCRWGTLSQEDKDVLCEMEQKGEDFKRFADTMFHETPSKEMLVHAWGMAWNTAIHEALTPEAHFVVFHPSCVEVEYPHEQDLIFLAILTIEQVHDIRRLLEGYGIASMMQSFSLELIG